MKLSCWQETEFAGRPSLRPCDSQWSKLVLLLLLLLLILLLLLLLIIILILLLLLLLLLVVALWSIFDHNFKF